MRCRHCGKWDFLVIIQLWNMRIICRNCRRRLFAHYDDMILHFSQIKPMTELSARPVRELRPNGKKRC